MDSDREAGVHRVLVTLPPKGRDEVLPLLGRHWKPL